MTRYTKEGADRLPNDGFDWINLKVILQDWNGQKKVKFGYFATFGNYLKNGLITFLFSRIEVLGDDSDQL